MFAHASVSRSISFPYRALALALAAGFAAVTCCSVIGVKAGAGLSVALTVRERSGIERRGEPVTSGVPISRSLDLRSIDGLRLAGSDGGEIPAQFQVTSRWGGAPGDAARPIRWLLIDFMASVGANGTATYYLRDGGSGSAVNTGLKVVRNDSTGVEIATGAARFTFGKRRFRLFEAVAVGGQ
jgi:hypothetical protein